MAPLYDVFLSYNSADQPAVEELARKLRKKRIKLFFDKWELIPGEPSQEALEKALDESRTCAVFVGPGSLGPWQNEEMRSAIDEWVGDKTFRVIPVLLPGAPDPRERKMPRFLRRPTWVDFRAGLNNEDAFHGLVCGIQGKPPGPGFGISAASSPYRCMAQPAEGFIQRSEYKKVLEALCPKGGTVQSSPSVGITTALRGAGGFGKTALAQALCFDERIRGQYPDGILWTTMGDNLDPESRVSRILDLIRWWTNTEPPGFKDLQAAGSKLREILNGQRVLLVVDDVWSAADVVPFQGLGNGSALLITTRDSQALPANSVPIEVDALASAEAVSLLCSGLPAGEFASLAARLGEWPLLLKLVNRQLREMVQEDGLAITDALREIWQALESEGFSAFNRDDHEDRHAAADQALSVSLGRLPAEEQKKFLHLAVFPEDAELPLDVLERFWGSARFETQRFCRRLHDLSLLLGFDRQEGTVRLHDVFRQLLIQRIRAELPALHQELLEKLKPASGWADLPIKESYLWRHLADHLRGAGREAELRGLLFDFRYLEAKLKATDVNSLIADFESLAREDAELQRIQSSLRLSAHVLAHHPEQLAAQLLGRLLDREEPETRRLLEGARSRRKSPWLRPRNASLTRPGGLLIHLLEGHSDSVQGLAVIDGRRVILACGDGVLRVRDLETGGTLRSLEGHKDKVTAVAVVDGQRVVSASKDGTLRVWDLETGQTLRSLEGHKLGVTAVAVVDGRRAVSASIDRTLRVWDLETGQTLRSLEGHESAVNAVAVVDGRAVSASGDRTLRVWDLETGETLRSLEGHRDGVNAVAAVDSRRAISVSIDRTLRVWDLESGQTLHSLTDYQGGVNAVAVMDGQRVVSLASLGGLKVLDLDSGQTLHTLEKPTAGAIAVAAVDGRRAVSAYYGGDLRMWDLSAGQTLQPLEGHRGRVTALAVMDGQRALSASFDGTLRVWALETGQTLRSLQGQNGINSIANGIKAMAVVDCRYAVSASFDRTLQVWDLETGESLRVLAGHPDGIEEVAIVDGRRAVFVNTVVDDSRAFLPHFSHDRTLQVCDLETGQPLLSLEGHTDEVLAVAVVDGRLALSASRDRTLRLWDLETGQTLRILEGHTKEVTTVAVVDGRRAISAADNVLRLWDLETGETLRPFRGTFGSVRALAMMDDRRAIFTSYDGTLRVWDLESGEELAMLTLDSPLLVVAVSPEKRIVMAGDSSGGVYFFDWVVPE